MIPALPLPGVDLDHVVERAEGPLRELDGARIFLTGGAGFFGRWLLESIHHATVRLGIRPQLVVLTRTRQGFAERLPHLSAAPWLELLPGDMGAFEFPRGTFDAVLHAATEPAGPAPAELFSRNVLGTRRVLDLAIASGAGRFLLTSSGAAYGPQPATETHVSEAQATAPSTADPASAYGQSKRASEFLAAALGAQHGFAAVVARCFAFVGPGLPLDTNYAIGNFIGDALAGRAIRVGGDGTPRRAYLYAADLAAWLWTLLVRGRPGVTYNVGAEGDLSIADLARLVALEVRPGTAVEIAGTPTPGQPPSRYVPSSRLAREELGLEAWVALPEAIRRTAAWWRAAQSQGR